jgi:hypothetical protein
MLSVMRKLAAVGAVAVGITGVAGGTAASAAPVPAAGPLASCSWHPANNARVTGYVDNGYTLPVYAAPACGYEGFDIYSGDPVTIHCGYYDQGDGLWWDYVTGLAPTRSFAGWVPDAYLNYPPAHQGC